MKTVPVGIAGELCIGGPTVNAGYIKRDDVSAKAFVKDPFASAYELETGFGRLYKTGDLFRLAADGTIHSLGRIGGDRQVKIRGMRTELGEIENAIRDLGHGIEDDGASKLSLVAVVYRKDEANNGGLLTAYIETVSGTPDLEEQRVIDAYLRIGLKETLPAHMLPSAYVHMTALPRTATGKIDYKALLASPAPKQSSRITDKLCADDAELSPVQSTVASVWKDVLAVEGPLVPSDDFFALGGHSLVLMRVQSAIEDRCGVNVSLGDMFAHPTVSGMADLLHASASSEGKLRTVSAEASNEGGSELKPHVNGQTTEVSNFTHAI